MRAIAIDGKACRAAPGDAFSGCLHPVNGWATENTLFLGSVAVGDGSNGIAAAPALLQVLDLKGAPVTLDAAFWQKEIVKRVRAGGGDYLVAVKGNQRSLQRAVHAVFERAGDAGFAGCEMAATVGDGHGRHEERYVTAIRDPEGLKGRADVGAVVMVGRERQVKGKSTSAAHFCTTSRRDSAPERAGYARGHWGVENGLRWCLDVSFREDANRTRDTNAGANLGIIRRVAVSLLKQDTAKGSIRAKRLNAALDHKYLLRVLQGFTAN